MVDHLTNTLDALLAIGLSPEEAARRVALAPPAAEAATRGAALNVKLGKAVCEWELEDGEQKDGDAFLIAGTLVLGAANLVCAGLGGDWTEERIRGFWATFNKQALDVALLARTSAKKD